MNYQTLQLFRPLISSRVTQQFGANLACVDSRGKIFGTTSKCPHGSHSYYQSLGMQGHSGQDISATVGEDVYHAGTFPGWWHSEVDNAGGIGVDVVSNEPLFFAMPIPTELINTAIPHKQNGMIGFIHYVKVRYWHLHKALGFEGKQVTCGQVIGLAGNTGASSGPHLHWAPKWCLKDGRGVGQGNGYVGAFDPLPYLNIKVTAKDHVRYLTPAAPPLPLTPQELKDARESLGAAQKLLLEIKKLMHKL